MSNTSDSRRLAAIILTAAVAIGISVVGVAAPASATSNATNAKSVLSKFNAARLAYTPAQTKVISNPGLDKAFQAYDTYCSLNWSECVTPVDLSCPGYDCSTPAGSAGAEWGVVKVASGSGVTTRAANALIAYEENSNKLITWQGNYGPVGFVVKGSWTYVALGVFSYPLGPPTFTLAGKAAVGSQLTMQHTGFTTEPSSITYQWYANGSPVGTNSANFTPTASQFNLTISVKASWVQPTLTPQVTLYAGTVGLGTFTPPAHLVTGRSNVGQVLTAAPPSAWQPAANIVHYVWYRDGKVIPLATDSTYTPQPSDKGHKIDLAETAEAAGGADYSSATAKTKTSTKVGGITFGLPDSVSIWDTDTALGPFYHDIIAVSTTGSWSPTPTSFTYQWYRGGKSISGATHATYRPGASDLNKILTVKVTAHKSGYVSASSTSESNPSWLVQPLDFNVLGDPTITGSSFTVGQTLTAHTASWTPTPTSFTYVWELDGTAIPHATHSTYKLVEADANHEIDVVVTAVKTGYAGFEGSDVHEVTDP